jgi:hypothetical protein
MVLDVSAPLPDRRWKHLRLDVDYSAPTPIWVDEGRLFVLMELSPLHLPRALEVALMNWQTQFDGHFAFDRWPHWDSKDSEQWHVAEGHRLFEELVRALPDAKITFDIWAVDNATLEDEHAGVRPPSTGRWVHDPRTLS